MSNARTRLFRAPGRVNLIGEHTDYNDGFVLPAAINFSTRIRLSPVARRELRIYSENFHEEVTFDLDDTTVSRRNHWSDYVIGVAFVLEQAGYRLRGANLSIRGEIPIGSGLSSSAALEVATAYALVANSNLTIEKAELAKLCRRAENEFVGARVGIMDQFVALHGKAHHALLLDCRSLDYESVPLSESARLVVCNTMVKHALASSAYNERREQCEAGVKHLAGKLPHVSALRDVSLDQLEQYGKNMPDVIYRRCHHVITENARVLDAAESLKKGDLNRFGILMNESHRSLRYDFEVSCKELDLLVELARQVDGVFGARLTGGGFGGCTVNLVPIEAITEFKLSVGREYERATKLRPEIYVCEAADGAEELVDAS